MAQTTSLLPAPQVQIEWIDCAKGAMIVLVVFGHAWRGLEKTGLMNGELFAAVDSRIYAFHMPVFFALSGWFFVKSLTKRSLKDFLIGRLERLLWPMILWTYIFLGVKVLAGGNANSPIGLDGFIVFPLPGLLHMWFLWALLLMSFAFSLLRLFSQNGKTSDLALGATVALVAALQFVPLGGEATKWIGAAIHNAPFFLLGIILGQKGFLDNVTRSTQILLALAFLVTIAAWPSIVNGAQAPLISVFLSACILGMFSGPTILRNRAIKEAMAKLGRASMPIYLAHTIFSAAAREALFAVGIEDISLHVLVGTSIGVIGPMVLLLGVRRMGGERLLGFS